MYEGTLNGSVRELGEEIKRTIVAPEADSTRRNLLIKSERVIMDAVSDEKFANRVKARVGREIETPEKMMKRKQMFDVSRNLNNCLKSSKLSAKQCVTKIKVDMKTKRPSTPGRRSAKKMFSTEK